MSQKGRAELSAFLLLSIAVIAGVVFGGYMAQILGGDEDDIHYGNYRPYFEKYHDKTLIMIGVDWCSVCKQTREFLASEKNPYIEFDAEASDEG